MDAGVRAWQHASVAPRRVRVWHHLAPLPVHGRRRGPFSLSMRPSLSPPAPRGKGAPPQRCPPVGAGAAVAVGVTGGGGGLRAAPAPRRRGAARACAL